MKTCPNCNEILGDSVKVCFKCNYNFDLKRVLNRDEITQKRIDAEKKIKEEMQLAEAKRLEERAEQLERKKQYEKNAKFEYISVVINDLADGTIDNNLVQKALTKYAEDGWRLHSIFTNEVGKTSSSVAIGFLGTTVNATIDQTIMVFERCIKPEEK